MALFQFRLPDIGEGVAEAEIVVWHVQPGDRIAEDQSLVDVMTDKATVDMTSPVDGTVLAIHGAVGAMVPVGTVLVEIETASEQDVAGDAEPAPPPPPPSSPPPSPPPAPPPPPPPPAPAAPPVPRTPGTQPLAAPATRRRAQELGVDLAFVPGSGPAGRITPDDLAAFVAAGGHAARPAGPAQRHGVEERAITGLRRKIAERLSETWATMPQITYVEECDVTELEALRAELNTGRAKGQPKLTMLPFIIRALVQVLPAFPHINARYDDEAGVLHQHAPVHVGMATQTPAGLMVPVIRHAEALDLWDTARAITRLAEAARDGTARREELSGSTITVTSLGPLGGVMTTPIVNRPEVAIVGPNKIADKPVVQGPFVAMRKVMNLSSSFDHRIVDGHDAALFVAALKRVLEHPALLFMEAGRG